MKQAFNFARAGASNKAKQLVVAQEMYEEARAQGNAGTAFRRTCILARVASNSMEKFTTTPRVAYCKTCGRCMEARPSPEKRGFGRMEKLHGDVRDNGIATDA